MLQASRLFILLLCFFVLSGCTREPRKESQPSVPQELATRVEIEVNGVKVTPFEHMKNMREEGFQILSEYELHAFKLSLTNEQLQALPASRREAIEQANPNAQPPTEGITIYIEGKPVPLDEALKEYSTYELKTLYSFEERQLILENLTDKQLNQLTNEQQSALRGQ